MTSGKRYNVRFIPESMSIIVFADKIAICFTSGRDILPDPEELRRCLEEAMKKIARLNKTSVVKSEKLNYA